MEKEFKILGKITKCCLTEFTYNNIKDFIEKDNVSTNYFFSNELEVKIFAQRLKEHQLNEICLIVKEPLNVLKSMLKDMNIDYDIWIDILNSDVDYLNTIKSVLKSIDSSLDLTDREIRRISFNNKLKELEILSKEDSGKFSLEVLTIIKDMFETQEKILEKIGEK